jgi:serine/threonine protein phosphatase PrpC
MENQCVFPTRCPFLLTIPVHLAMEDAHVAVLTLEDGTRENNAFFGVYDGHGGNLLPSFSSLHSLHSQAAPSQSLRENMSISVFLRRKLIARSVTTRR